jgi:DMSO reductase anchor subunit
MRPAWSVILLTTLIGVGQGLFLAAFTVQSYALFGLLPVFEPRGLYVSASVIALILLAGGLVASFFHLGRPERAWRTATQWRTSWLSREVIVLPAFIGVVLLWGLAHLGGVRLVVATLATGTVIDATVVLGAIGTVLAFALFISTGMVYASVRFLREWATPLTLANYTLLGGASGFTLAAALAAQLAPGLLHFLAGWALVLTLLGAASRIASLWRNARLKPTSTLQTAIGIKHPRIVQKAAGFQGGSFNTREFFHRRSVASLRAVKWGFLVAAFAVPALLLAAGSWQGSAALLAAAFAVQYLGLIAERWFFLAQANHPQNLYYQALD